MSQPKNLLELKPEEFKEFLDSFDHVFSDCDGVIWALSPLPGAGDFFKLMQKHGKTVHFVSNNSIRSKENYEAKFSASNIENGYDYLTVPSISIAEYLKSVNFNKKIYALCCREGIHVLESYGFQCKTGPIDSPDDYDDLIEFQRDDPEVGAVVLDNDFQINLPKLHRAITYLNRPDVLFICGATDKHIHFQPEVFTLGTGIFTDIVAQEVKRQPIMLGKPGKTFGEFAMLRAGVTDPSRVLFIGDMLQQDVGLGKAIGFKTLLVLTHIKKEEMLAQEVLVPDFYAESLGSIVPLL